MEIHAIPARIQEFPSNLSSRIKGERPTIPASYTQTIFHEPWWLWAASRGSYQEALATAGGITIGRLPYISSRAAGLTLVGMPLMTHVLGPVLINDTTTGNCTRSVNQVAVTAALIGQLPPASHVSFRLHGGISNTLAFDAAGFQNRVHFTVEVPPAAAEVQWRHMRDKTRNVIRRAQDRLCMVELNNPREFMDIYEQNLSQTGARNFYDRDVCETLIAECLARGAGRVLAATNPAGSYEAAVFTVWDQSSEYYFMSTRSPNSMNGAVSLLIWEAIQHAASRGLVFDMDSIHVKGKQLPNLLLLTGFGGVIKPRYSVHRTSVAGRVAKTLKDLFA